MLRTLNIVVTSVPALTIDVTLLSVVILLSVATLSSVVTVARVVT